VKTRTTPRARQREDRAGDPLDGLVNLFDLGIVLAVGFLLAALSSLELTPALLRGEAEQRPAGGAPRGAGVAAQDQESAPVELAPGERVVGRGEQIGVLYRLEDGRTIVVRPRDGAP
jgi:hypothetical protein